MLAQAMPFMLLLFVLFPARPGPPLGAAAGPLHGNVSGISDTMSPGSIAQLSQSDAIAFRVQFKGQVPPQSQLYWRGPVMPAFDGRTWSVQADVGAPTPRFAVRGPAVLPSSTRLTLEPNGKFWVFALEMPGNLPPDSASDRRTISPSRAKSCATACATPSVPWPQTNAGLNESRAILRDALALPSPRQSTRTRALGTTIGADRHGDDGAAILATAQEFFNRQLLIYTLNPPLLGPDMIDEFLFDIQARLLRTLCRGLRLRPARRRGAGTRGGRLPREEKSTRSTATWWCDSTMPTPGPKPGSPGAAGCASIPRPSPPQAASTANLAAAVPAGEELPFLARTDLSWVRDLRYRLDAVTNGWNQWVLGYNPQKQRDFLAGLGFGEPDWRRMTAALAILCGLVLLGLTAWVLRNRRRIDPAFAAWQRFAGRLAARGTVWHPWEGPLAFADRAAAASRRMPYRFAKSPLCTPDCATAQRHETKISTSCAAELAASAHEMAVGTARHLRPGRRASRKLRRPP
jgi:hypothetical protein